ADAVQLLNRLVQSAVWRAVPVGPFPRLGIFHGRADHRGDAVRILVVVDLRNLGEIHRGTLAAAALLARHAGAALLSDEIQLGPGAQVPERGGDAPYEPAA